MIHYKNDCEIHWVDCYKLCKHDFPVFHTFGDMFWKMLLGFVIPVEYGKAFKKVIRSVLTQKNTDEKLNNLLYRVQWETELGMYRNCNSRMSGSDNDDE